MSRLDVLVEFLHVDPLKTFRSFSVDVRCDEVSDEWYNEDDPTIEDLRPVLQNGPYHLCEVNVVVVSAV
jgi:hypothetical protein